MGTDFYSVPSNATVRSILPRNIFAANDAVFDPSSLSYLISGSKSRDTGSSPTDLLRAGLFLGKISAAGTELGKYAPSILGVVPAAIGGGQTAITVPAAVAVEIVRRIGATGTFNITGATSAGLTARTKTATYSNVNQTTGVVTITALATGAVSAVNAVETLPAFVDTGAGTMTFTLTIEGITTGTITFTHSDSAATLATAMQTALNGALGTSAVAVSGGGGLTAITVTFSGTSYAGRPLNSRITSTILTNAAADTIGGVSAIGPTGAAGTSTSTTAGVTAAAADEGDFVAGSIVQPTDGSQTPIFVLSGGYAGDWHGVDVLANATGLSIDQVVPAFLVRGSLKSPKLVNFLADDFGNNTDASVQNWIITQLSNANRQYTYANNPNYY